MNWWQWLVIGLLVFFVVFSNPWFLRWLFNRGWEKTESKRWRERFLKERL